MKTGSPEVRLTIAGKPTNEEYRAAVIRLQAINKIMQDATDEVMDYEDSNRVKILTDECAQEVDDIRHAIAPAGSRARFEIISEYEFSLYETRARQVAEKLRALITRHRTKAA